MKSFSIFIILVFFIQIDSFAQVEKEQNPSPTNKQEIILPMDIWEKQTKSKMPPSSLDTITLSTNYSKKETKKWDCNVDYSLKIIKPMVQDYPYLEWSIDSSKNYTILQLAPTNK